VQKKNFGGLSEAVRFVFWVVFLFLIVVSGSVSVWFWALSMLFSVKLQHGWREVRMLPKATIHHTTALLGTKFQKKKGTIA